MPPAVTHITWKRGRVRLVARRGHVPLDRGILVRVTRLFAFIAAAVIAAPGAGCGDDPKPPPPATGRDGGPDTGPRDGGPMDAGPGDAAVDAARLDAALDGAPSDGAVPDAPPDSGPCMTADDCDDGLVCNGSETCVEGDCAGGVSVECNDGIECTVDVCLEPMGDCMSTPDHDACSAGEMCIAAGSRGCIVPCSGTSAICELVAPQCGCRLTDGCYLTSTMPRRVCLTAGTSGPGSSCSMANDCSVGVGCRTLSGMVRICSRFCTLDSHCGGGGSRCVVMTDDPDGARYCSRACDPITQTGCVVGSACTIGGATTGSPYTDCQARASGGGTQGATCMSEAQCAGGYTCTGASSVDGGTDGTCERFCTATSACPGGTTCRLSPAYATISGMTYGLCR